MKASRRSKGEEEDVAKMAWHHHQSRSQTQPEMEPVSFADGECEMEVDLEAGHRRRLRRATTTAAAHSNLGFEDENRHNHNHTDRHDMYQFHSDEYEADEGEPGGDQTTDDNDKHDAETHAEEVQGPADLDVDQPSPQPELQLAKLKKRAKFARDADLESFDDWGKEEDGAADSGSGSESDFEYEDDLMASYGLGSRAKFHGGRGERVPRAGRVRRWHAKCCMDAKYVCFWIIVFLLVLAVFAIILLQDTFIEVPRAVGGDGRKPYDPEVAMGGGYGGGVVGDVG